MSLTRQHGWELRLDAYLRECWRKPFVWGEHDCVLFACGAIAALTGEDPSAPLRGSYDSAVGAARKVREICGDQADVMNLAGHFARELGFAELPGPLFAQRGDAVLLSSFLCGDPEARGPALGIVGLCGWKVYAPGAAGLVEAELKDGIKAWRVG